MDSINTLIRELFGSSVQNISTEETFATFSLEAEGEVLAMNDPAGLRSALSALPQAHWTISVAIDGQDSPHSFASVDLVRMDEFLANLSYSVALEPHARFKFHLTKSHANCELKVFDPQALFKWIAGLALGDALSSFDELVGDCEALTFISPAFTNPVATKLFRFAPSGCTATIRTDL